MKESTFDLEHVLHELKHYLPSQTPIKDFVHHNTLHAFQDHKFYDAIFKASQIFGYQISLQLKDYRELYKLGRIQDKVLDRCIVEAKGEAALANWKHNLLEKKYDEHNNPRIGYLRAHWKNDYHIDLDTMVHPMLFRIIGSYLDQGIGRWHFPSSKNGFLEDVRKLEKTSMVSFFKTKEVKKRLLDRRWDIENLLDQLVGDARYYEQYLFDQQFSHRGWSGMAATLEAMPQSLMNPKTISLKDFIAFELLMELDALHNRFGTQWKPLKEYLRHKPENVLAPAKITSLHEAIIIWQNAFEWSYYDNVLNGMSQIIKNTKDEPVQKSFQAMFCIDERECSLRRYTEKADAGCETFGVPGFFGVEFYFQQDGAKFTEKLCPAPVTPKYLIKEYDATEERKNDVLYTNKTHTLIGGYITSFVLGFWSLARLVQNLFSPKMSPAISDAFAHMGKDSKLTVLCEDTSQRENGLQIGFTLDEMSTRVGNLLKGIGLTKNFAPIIYAVAHGSSSANNPHHGAHDCGACSGKPGGVNSRVFANMANRPEVRNYLRATGIDIPDSTQFLGGMHDTASDEIAFYDEHILHEKNAQLHAENLRTFETALDFNAMERSRRFASINSDQSLNKVRKAIKQRSVSLFEPRPELGHGTNSLCIVGRRSISKGLFLDRRAFLNSYDYRQDPTGELLVNVLAPIAPVCGGINLEYYFSRVDNYKLGAGTKLPHNVMGLIGVANSSDGDLRPGLPLQMIEVHDPIRLLVIVEHYPEIVLKTIQHNAAMYEWYKNEWVHLVAVHPETNSFYYFKEDAFHVYDTVNKMTKKATSMEQILKASKEMETNHIVHATQENLDVSLIQQN